MSETARPPVLLAMADYYGTLAAVRCLGRRGVPVTIAEGRLLAPARWSRFVTRRVPCPDLACPERFVEWLLSFGAKNPGHVLYPTSDDLCWLYALHREELSKHFHLYQPGLGPIYSLLDKTRLNAACAEVGLGTPRTWLPQSRADVERAAAEVDSPVVIKPRTQVLYESRTKGVHVTDRARLVERYFEFAKSNRYRAPLLAQDPLAGWPMIQAYHPEARHSIYGLGGFIDESGELFVARAARKVLQRPRRLGIGLCFEDAEPIPEVFAQVAALCRHLHYHGVFEVELIETPSSRLLIDFNPRFYGQMAFEIARGLPLPALVYEAALGCRDTIRFEVARARAWVPEGRHIYAHRALLGLVLAVQELAGGASGQE
ncbi:MAG: carboxylate--amine ligase, partial [Myxococcaceae bacterium]